MVGWAWNWFDFLVVVLQIIDEFTGKLSLWRHTDTSTAPELTEDSKKAFAERVERLCHEDKLPKILQGITKVIEAQILCIDDGGGTPQKISLSTFQANRQSQQQKSPSQASFQAEALETEAVLSPCLSVKVNSAVSRESRRGASVDFLTLCQS
eukprot:CAMPEP_0169283314 /NCGR_PEP_ID=MMETSP1016-20121227/57471_1 /TAXON_ID=342587 /ORGANISM="Karlodinium micrum, Strain CCMP2283" /LENGTH=152 /DNA_ID=CAMNT_0009372491 /DNA_START=80 /DNA_END=535 /DNA_ORIENTATION=+